MRATIRQMQQVLHHKSLSASASNAVPAVTDYEGEQCEGTDRRKDGHCEGTDRRNDGQCEGADRRKDGQCE